MKQAIIYSRFSPRPNAHLSTSIEFQEHKCRAYCEAKGFDVLASYRDAAISGKDVNNRPGLQQALLHVSKIRGVLVAYDLFRVARSVMDAVRICENLEKRRADLALVTQPIDTTTALGRFMFKLMALVGELERETTGERTSIKLQDMHRKGLRISSLPRFGFHLVPGNPGRVWKDRKEQEVIRIVVGMWKDKKKQVEICDFLTDKGYEPRGQAWHITTIARIIQRYGKKDASGRP